MQQTNKLDSNYTEQIITWTNDIELMNNFNESE